MRISDWSSDVCSSDLLGGEGEDVACLALRSLIGVTKEAEVQEFVVPLAKRERNAVVPRAADLKTGGDNRPDVDLGRSVDQHAIGIEHQNRAVGLDPTQYLDGGRRFACVAAARRSIEEIGRPHVGAKVTNHQLDRRLLLE